jgi:GH18 family chitinase
MRRKTELAFKRGGGIMFWELSQDTSDDTSLLTAIHGALRDLKR